MEKRTNNGVRMSKDIEDELSARKSVSARVLREHTENIRKNYPEIEALRLEINALAVEFAEKMVQSPENSAQIRKLGLLLTAEKEKGFEKMLADNGFPPDYLKLKPVCPVCGDSGFADGELCACIKNVIIKKRFKSSGLNPEQTFERFRHDLVTEPRAKRFLDNLFSFCLEYAEKFPENPIPDLLLRGQPGVGKTFLLNAIGDRVLKRGYSVLRITANGLVRSVMESLRGEGEMPDYVMPDLLILDDLGTEPMINNVTIETILSVICERQDRNRATLIATNKDLNDIGEDYGTRIQTRLLSPQRVRVIEMNTPVIRIMKT